MSILKYGKTQHFAPFVGGEVEYVVLENRGSGKKIATIP